MFSLETPPPALQELFNAIQKISPLKGPVFGFTPTAVNNAAFPTESVPFYVTAAYDTGQALPWRSQRPFEFFGQSWFPHSQTWGSLYYGKHFLLHYNSAGQVEESVIRKKEK